MPNRKVSLFNAGAVVELSMPLAHQQKGHVLLQGSVWCQMLGTVACAHCAMLHTGNHNSLFAPILAHPQTKVLQTCVLLKQPGCWRVH